MILKGRAANHWLSEAFALLPLHFADLFGVVTVSAGCVGLGLGVIQNTHRT
jgi:hypothetical protein